MQELSLGRGKVLSLACFARRLFERLTSLGRTIPCGIRAIIVHRRTGERLCAFSARACRVIQCIASDRLE